MSGLRAPAFLREGKKTTGIGGRPIICCFLIIARPTTAVIKKINNKEIIKTIVEIISILLLMFEICYMHYSFAASNIILFLNLLIT